jgi:hypothetical protein
VSQLVQLETLPARAPAERRRLERTARLLA